MPIRPESSASSGPMKPFLRWAGGKQNLVEYLVDFAPLEALANGSTYYEPFLGAGSLFLALDPRRAILSDANRHLIDCFQAIKDHPREMDRYLRLHERSASKEYYYRVRQDFNDAKGEQTVAQASRFLYLNRACFNGIFRVNQKGEFNVPCGDKKNLLLPNRAFLEAISLRLSRALLRAASYENIADEMRSGDFVYLDPPYPPLNGSSYFVHYTKDRFDCADQENVAAFARHVSAKGCAVMLTNADLPIIRGFFNGWRITTVEVTRYVSCRAHRHRVKELIITNF